MILVYFSLAINILVAGFWATVLSCNIKSIPADRAFGIDTVARRILGNLYLAIAIASIVSVALPTLLPQIIIVLFPIQILYKVISFITAQNKHNPVIISNVCIATLHIISLFVLYL